MSLAEHSLRIPAEMDELETLRQFFEDVAQTLQLDREPTLDLLVALNEVVTNIVVHGYQGASGAIEVRVQPRGADLLLRVRDQAPRFDPTTVPPPRIDLPLELRPLGGMGLLLTRHYTDELRYCATPEGDNELTLIKRGVLADSRKEHDGGADS